MWLGILSAGRSSYNRSCRDAPKARVAYSHAWPRYPKHTPCHPDGEHMHHEDPVISGPGGPWRRHMRHRHNRLRRPCRGSVGSTDKTRWVSGARSRRSNAHRGPWVRRCYGPSGDTMTSGDSVGSVGGDLWAVAQAPLRCFGDRMAALTGRLRHHDLRRPHDTGESGEPMDSGGRVPQRWGAEQGNLATSPFV